MERWVWYNVDNGSTKARDGDAEPGGIKPVGRQGSWDEGVAETVLGVCAGDCSIGDSRSGGLAGVGCGGRRASRCGSSDPER